MCDPPILAMTEAHVSVLGWWQCKEIIQGLAGKRVKESESFTEWYISYGNT
jgi:hypothetical protein